MTYEIRITVRGYELDSFGHVNNAVFLKYCEEARWQILRKKNLFDYFNYNRLLLVVTSVEMRYVKEARVFDELVVNTNIKRTPPYLEFRHIIRHANTGDIITRAKIKTLLVDNDRIPFDIPDSLAE
jgi:YbgC/YbaW family acyl-CoA thioester hydrolase